MTDQAERSTLWHGLVAAVPPGTVLHVSPGEWVRTLPEADTAQLRLGMPLRAVPSLPVGGFAAQCAVYPADTELAFLRARSQSADGTVWMHPARAGETFWAVCAHVEGHWQLRHWVGVSALQGHAAVPVEFVAPLPPSAHDEIGAVLTQALDALGASAAQVVAEVLCSAEGAELAFAWADAHDDAQIARLIAAADPQGAACLRFLMPEAGHVIAVQGVEQACALPGVVAVEVVAQVDDAIRHITSVAARDAVGWVLCTGTTPADAQARAEVAAAAIVIETTAFLQG